MKRGSSLVEKDLTSFEYGIHAALKEIEGGTLKHVADHILQDTNDIPEPLTRAVINDRSSVAI